MTTALSTLRQTPEHTDFLQVFNRLCVALRDPGDDSGVTQGIYFDALKDLPMRALEAGAAALMREPGRRFFPTTAEWRAAAEHAQMQQLREAVKPARSEPWRYECDRCEDTGWIQGLTCDGGASQWPEALAPHEAVRTKKLIRKGIAWRYRAEDRATDTPAASTCGREQSHAPHSYTKACPCRQTNRTWLRHQHFGKGE